MSSTLSPSFWIMSLMSMASLGISLTLLVKEEPKGDDVKPAPPAQVTTSAAIPHLQLPPAMEAPMLNLPETPLLKPTMPGKISPENLAKMRRANFGRMRLEETMMNGELDRTKYVPAGATDPDSMWRGQVDRANRTLQETGMGHLNLRGR